MAIGPVAMGIALAAAWVSAREDTAEQAEQIPQKIVLEDFDAYRASIFGVWKTRWGSPKDAKKIYAIRRENGRRFLHASTRRDNTVGIQAGKLVNDHGEHRAEVKWPIRDYPVLSWEWRVHELPTGGHERYDDRNDSAAGVYVVFFKRKLPLLSWKYQPYNILKYVWSAQMPVEQHATRAFSLLGLVPIIKTVYVAVHSGSRDLGKWIRESRHVLADYKKHFGEAPKYDPLLIAILTDSNDTKSAAAADYDNFIALRSDR